MNNEYVPSEWTMNLRALPEFIRKKIITVAQHEADKYLTEIDARSILEQKKVEMRTGYIAIGSGAIAHLWSLPWHALGESMRQQILDVPVENFIQQAKELIYSEPVLASFAMPEEGKSYLATAAKALSRNPARIGLHFGALKEVAGSETINATVSKLIRDTDFPEHAVIVCDPESFHGHSLCRNMTIECVGGMTTQEFTRVYQPVKCVAPPEDVKKRLRTIMPRVKL